MDAGHHHRALGPTAYVYEHAGGMDPRQKPVDYFDQRVQNLTIDQLLKKRSPKRIANFLLRVCVFIVFICSSDDITTCSALVRQYGPTVFLPILICAMVVGMPLMYLEMGLGQFTSCNPVAIFSNMAPIAAGIGYSMIVISVLDVFRQVHLSTIFANILFQTLKPLFGADFYMSSCLFQYNADCIDPHVRCGGISDSHYSSSELTTTSAKSKFYLTYKEENSQCVAHMQVKYAHQGLTANRLSQSSGIERYIDLFLTNIGHDQTGEQPRAAMDYNIAGLIILIAMMLMMYYDTSFIEGLGVFGTLCIFINVGFNYHFLHHSSTTVYNNFNMPPTSTLQDYDMWMAVLNYVLMAIQVGQAGMMTLASSNNFSNNVFRDAIMMAIIVTVVPYTAACFLTSNWEKFVVSQMNESEDRDRYFNSGEMDTGLKYTRNTVHITSTAIFGEDQLIAIFVMMTYFLTSTMLRMLISFRAIVRTFQEQFSAEFAMSWKNVCRILTCCYVGAFLVANTSSMRLLLDSIRVGCVRATPVIVLGYLLVVMFCYGIRPVFLDLNTMLFMSEKKETQKAAAAAAAAATAAAGHRAHSSSGAAAAAKTVQDSSRSAMRRYSSLLNIYTGFSWTLFLLIGFLLAKEAWTGGMREGDLFDYADATDSTVSGFIWYFSLLIIAPMVCVAIWRVFHYSSEVLNGTITIRFLFSPNAFYGPKDDRHRMIVANESNSVRM